MTETHRRGYTAQTVALRRMLATRMDRSAIDDLLFLEAWEANPTDWLADTLRASQIRRANPALAIAIRAEFAAGRRAKLVTRVT